MLGCSVGTKLFTAAQDIEKVHSGRPRAPSGRDPSPLSKIFGFFRSFDERKSSIGIATLDQRTYGASHAHKMNYY